jgi:hypothetical protein
MAEQETKETEAHCADSEQYEIHPTCAELNRAKLITFSYDRISAKERRSKNILSASGRWDTELAVLFEAVRQLWGDLRPRKASQD